MPVLTRSQQKAIDAVNAYNASKRKIAPPKKKPVKRTEEDDDGETSSITSFEPRTAEEKRIAKAEASAKYYAANRAKVLASQALHYLKKNPTAKMRATTAIKYGFSHAAPEPLMKPEVLKTRIAPALSIKEIKQTPINPKTNKYPPLSYLGVRDWIINRTDRPEKITQDTLKAQVGDWKITMKMFNDNPEEIDNVIPILNNVPQMMAKLKEKYPNVDTLQKHIKLLKQITKYNDAILLAGKNNLNQLYDDEVKLNTLACEAYTKQKQTNQEYALPEYQLVVDTVKDELGVNSQFYLFTQVYRETGGRDDYGALRIAEKREEVDFSKYKNWFVKNSLTDEPDAYEPAIIVKTHKSAKSGKGVDFKGFTPQTAALIKLYLDKHQDREWLFQDEETGEPFVNAKGEEGKVATWVKEKLEDVKIYGLGIKDLRQMLATELRKDENTDEDRARNAKLMNHTVMTHITNYGRPVSDEIKRSRENQEIDPTFELKSKVAIASRKRETEKREANERIAMSGLLGLSRSKGKMK